MDNQHNTPYRPKPSNRTRWTGFIASSIKLWLIKTGLIAVIAVVTVLVARHYIGKVQRTSTTARITPDERIDITPTQIRSIESIGQWSFLEISDEELVDTTRHGFFSDDQLVRIYYGTLRLGIDTRQAHEGWLAMDGDTLRAILPPIRLLDNEFIDETRTRSFIATGKWAHADRKQMYDRAAATMRRRCLTKANYESARKNAKTQFEGMLRSMGFEHVSVGFEQQKQ